MAGVMDADEKVVRHLEMVQSVIERMARNSFLLKGWAVTLVAASLWLIARSGTSGFSAGFLVVLLAVAFWGLDGYFLRQERLFRKLYDSVRTAKETDFSMDTRRFSEGVPDIWMTCVGDPSPNTLLRFYAPLLAAGVILSWCF